MFTVQSCSQRQSSDSVDHFVWQRVMNTFVRHAQCQVWKGVREAPGGQLKNKTQSSQSGTPAVNCGGFMEQYTAALTIGRTCVWRFGHLAYPCKKQVENEVHLLVNTRTPPRGLGRARTLHEPNHTSTTIMFFAKSEILSLRISEIFKMS